MGILLRGSPVAGSAATPLVLTKPAGVVAGDILFIYHYGLSTNPPALTSGFTSLLSGTDHLGNQFRVSYKIAGGSEPASYSLDCSPTSGLQQAYLWALQGEDQVTPTEGAGFSAVLDGSAPSATPTQSGSQLITLWQAAANAVVTTPPSGQTQLLPENYYGAFGTLTGYWKSLPTSGAATGTSSATWSSDQTRLAITLIVRTATPTPARSRWLRRMLLEGFLSSTVVSPPSGVATVSWDVPAYNSQGQPYSNVTGYKIYYGQVSGGPYPNSQSVSGAGSTSTTITALAQGTWYFKVAVVDNAGNESLMDFEVSKTI